jgi:cytochrome P450
LKKDINHDSFCTLGDSGHWDKPLELNIQRQLTRENHNIFGGSRYACIGSRIALKYFSEVLPGILANLSGRARIIEDDIEVDGNWVAERVITRLPILVQ